MFWQRMRLAFSERSTGTVPFPQSSERSNVLSRICAGRCSRGPLQCTRRDRVPRAPSPSSYSLRAGKLECENDAHVLLMNCAQATHEERRTGAILLRPRWRELAPQRIADRDRCRPIIAKQNTCTCVCQHMHLPMQRRRCEGARRRAHIDIDSESLIRVTGRGRCSPHHMRSIHKRMCARTQVTQHACTHAHTRTHSRTHTCTHSRSISLSVSLPLCLSRCSSLPRLFSLACSLSLARSLSQSLSRARMAAHIHTSRATQVSIRTMPLQVRAHEIKHACA